MCDDAKVVVARLGKGMAGVCSFEVEVDSLIATCQFV
jgi:hypothetical protein